MKLLCAEYNESGELAYSVVGDNALLRNNEDFYLPEEVGVGIRFYAEDMERALLDRRLTPATASSFDGSAAISPLLRREGSVENWTCALRVNDEVCLERRVGELPRSPEQLIAGMSRYYLLKIGDFIYCGDIPRFAVRAGDRLRLALNGDDLLDFQVR